jgi:hypothetical protein
MARQRPVLVLLAAALAAALAAGLGRAGRETARRERGHRGGHAVRLVGILPRLVATLIARGRGAGGARGVVASGAHG